MPGFQRPNQTSSFKAAVELPRPSLIKVRSVINLIVRHLGRGWGEVGAAVLTVHFDKTLLPKALRHAIKSSVAMTTI